LIEDPDLPVVFELRMIGQWAAHSWVDIGDQVRVIGTFSSHNNFRLLIDDNEESHADKASLLIVEPSILIPTTKITNAFPCIRKAFLGHQFKSLQGDVNYPLVLGNIIHQIFQQILEKMDFKKETVNKIIKDAIKGQLLLLYFLKKTEEQVEEDANRAVKNITLWLDGVLARKSEGNYGCSQEEQSRFEIFEFRGC